MKRRPLIAGALAALADPGSVLAQAPAGKVWRIGVLSLSVPPEPLMRPWIAQILAPLGYVAGRNLHIDFKFAQHNVQALPKFAAELVDARPDLLIGLLIREGLALKRATTTIPIVMMYATTPVELGLVESLARPGGNITGTASVSPELYAKTFQILRELNPQTKHVALVSDGDFPGMDHYVKQGESAASLLGIRTSTLTVRSAAEIDSALLELLRDRPNAIIVGMAGMFIEHYCKVIEFAARHKLPALYGTRQPVLDGGLISYSPNFSAMSQRNAWMIDKIFKGAKPSDIPMEEPAAFRLSINMQTARAMGLAIPPIILLRADEVIE